MDKLSELQHCQLQSKLSVQVAPSPKLSYRSYFEHLLSLAMLKGSEKSPSSSSADTSTGTEELQQGAHGPAHNMGTALLPSLQAQRTWAQHEIFRVGFQFLSVPTGKI